MTTETTETNKAGLPKGTGIKLAVQVAFIPAYAGMLVLIAAGVRTWWLPTLPDLDYLGALGVMACVAGWRAVRIMAQALGETLAEARDKDWSETSR